MLKTQARIHEQCQGLILSHPAPPQEHQGRWGRRQTPVPGASF